MLDGINQYLRTLPAGITVELAPPVVVPEGANVEAVRQTILELRADLHATRSAPLYSSVAKAAIRASIAKHAGDCPLNVGHIIEGAPVQWPTVLTRGKLFGHVAMEAAPPIAGFAQSRTIDTFAVLCWLAGEAIAERMDAEVDSMADDTLALSPDERAEREAALLAQILELERIEETFIEDGGTEVARRPDHDPRAVLGLADAMPAPRER